MFYPLTMCALQIVFMIMIMIMVIQIQPGFYYAFRFDAGKIVYLTADRIINLPSCFSQCLVWSESISASE